MGTHGWDCRSSSNAWGMDSDLCVGGSPSCVGAEGGLYGDARQDAAGLGIWNETCDNDVPENLISDVDAPENGNGTVGDDVLENGKATADVGELENGNVTSGGDVLENRKVTSDANELGNENGTSGGDELGNGIETWTRSAASFSLDQERTCSKEVWLIDDVS